MSTAANLFVPGPDSFAGGLTMPKRQLTDVILDQNRNFHLGSDAMLAIVMSAALLLLPPYAEALSPSAPDSILVAQSDGEDSYDPFADYSEFEESMDEEEDINFFRNGRMLTLGFNVGYRGWTQTLNQIYSSNSAFGLYMSYFFDLRFAMQFSYMTSEHMIYVAPRNNASSIQGTNSVTQLSAAMKYYFNTQNVTRGLADLNPYGLLGFSQIYRTQVVSGNDKFAKDSAFAFDFGAGIEVPIMRNKMYVGLQTTYQVTNFTDEGRIITDQDDRSTGLSPQGDTWNMIGILGVNF